MDVWHLREFWQYGVAVLSLVLSVVASGHALLHKHDSRAAVSWVGLVWLAPLVGSVLYFIFGVNRIHRRAVDLRGRLEPYYHEIAVAPCDSGRMEEYLPNEMRHLAPIARVVDTVAQRALLPGNRVTPLVNGDNAFPAMLEAIAAAQKSVALSTYIFDRDEAGLAFAGALGDAVRRGVEVRVLIDATGTRYSWPSILGVLRREKVRHARFLPAFPLWRLMSMNLRNHRKLLVIDGHTGFTGGMNIRAGNLLLRKPSSPVQDIHFRIEGPVVAHLQEVFADDWLFTTGESIRGEQWFPHHEPVGPVMARGIADGPDDDVDPLRWAILGALSAARTSVRVLTPYFLPDPPVVAALNLAAMRGVIVDIILPSRSNLPFVHWASRSQWWEVLERGCRLWLTPGPFDHSKVMLVDDGWAFVGSANWDPRSLRLNFEFNLECYDTPLAQALDRVIQAKMEPARRVTLEELEARSFAGKLRDGAARLLTPYL